MGMFDFFKKLLNVESVEIDTVSMDINPATGLPMLDSCIDVAGNPYGIDNSNTGSMTDSFCDMVFDDQNK